MTIISKTKEPGRSETPEWGSVKSNAEARTEARTKVKAEVKGWARAGVMIAVVALVAGCSSFSHDTRASNPRYLATGPHPIVVTESERTLPVPFGANDSALAAHVLAPVQVFADDFVDQGGGTMYIEVAAGQPNELLAGKLSYLGAELRKRGIKASELIVRPAGATRSTEITLVYAKYQASVPGCPDWSQSLSGFHRNVAHSNFGCATRGNLAKMLANPRDLVKPRTFTNADANHSSRAISDYRSGEAEDVTTSSSQVGGTETQ